MTQAINKIKYVAAIDIGTTKIVALAGKKNENGKLEVLGLHSAPSKGVKRGVVLNIEETINSIKTVVDELNQKLNIQLTDVFVGIAGQHIRSLQNRDYINREKHDTEITEDEVNRLIQNMYRSAVEADEEILHVVPQSYTVDMEQGVRNPVGMCGKKIEGNYHIVIGKVASANNIKKCINRVGLNVNSLILEPLASSFAVLSEDEKEAGVALVDIGGGTTDIAVFFEGIIRHTAVIPFGGNVITADIKNELGILEKQAEKLKIQFGSSLAETTPADSYVSVPGINGREPKEISLKSLAYIIQSRMEEIIGFIDFEIEASKCADKLGAGIVITGGGALLNFLPQLIAYKTGKEVRIGFPNEHLSGNVKEEFNQPKFSTAIGLILTGYEKIEKEIKQNTYKFPEEIECTTNNEIEQNQEIIEEKIEENTIEESKLKKKTKTKKGILDSIIDFFDEKDEKL